MCVGGGWVYEYRSSDPLELELQVIVGHLI